MKRKRNSHQQIDSLCGEVHPDDGLDPSEFFRPGRKRGGSHRKTWQLCQQVAETLSLVLGDELGDLRVVAVRPAPDAAQLAVLIAPALPGAEADPAEVSARLDAAAGRLRAEIAAAITRRRAPKLLFQFVPAPTGREAQP